MQKFIVRRLLFIIPVLFVVSAVTLTLLKMVPGSLAVTLLGDLVTVDDIVKLEERMGLNHPLVGQYFTWIGNVFHGDSGISTAGGEPVASVVLSHVKPTASLTPYALIITSVITISIGTLAAKNKGTGIGHDVTVLSLVGVSLPSPLFGLFLMLILAVRLHLLPVSGYVETSRGLWPHIKSLTLSAIALGFMNAALTMCIIRSAVLEIPGSDYIRMVKAKGARNFVITTKHALRNSLVMIIMMIGQSAVQMLASAVAIESLFATLGLGQLMVNSIGRRGYYVIQAVVFLIALFNVLINMLVGLPYGAADLRVRAT